MSTFYQAFPERAGKPVIHVDAGTWTMVAQIGGKTQLKEDGYKKGIVVQGTVDGEPVVTAMYAGGNDYKHVKALVEEKGLSFKAKLDEEMLKEVLADTDCMALPNIHPENKGTGPFPDLEGSILNEDKFFQDGARACIRANLPTIITTDVNIENIEAVPGAPIVLTAGGSKDPYFGKVLATLTGRTVYAMQDKDSKAVTETTTLGTAIAGKAACLGIHPYKVDMSALGVTYKELEPFGEDMKKLLLAYKQKMLERIGA
jgi:sugar (pentulose or hexulose) kinase